MTDPRRSDRLIASFRDAMDPQPAEIDALWKRVADPDAAFRILRPTTRPPKRRRLALFEQSGSPRVWAGAVAAVAAALLVAWWIGSNARDAASDDPNAPSLSPYERQPSDAPSEAATITAPRVDTARHPPAEPAPAPADAQPDARAPAVDRTSISKPQPMPAPRAASSRGVALDPLAKETALIRGAEASLRTGDPAGALDVLAEHAVEFPEGVLTIERKALRVIALCRSGNTAQGRGEAALLRRHEASKPYRERIRRACELD